MTGSVSPDSITAIRAVWTLQPPLSGHYDGVAAARTEFKGGSRRRGPGSRFRAVGRALRLPVTGTARGIRKATHAHGAGESGLGKLIELHGVNGAGDVMITVALASTVFFSVPTDEARGRVALYLAHHHGAVHAPRAGDRPRSWTACRTGARAAMAAAMGARALLALVLSGAVISGSIENVSGRARRAGRLEGVRRGQKRGGAQALPPRFSLVKANSRVTLCGLLATGVAAPIAAGLQQVGPRWPLYGAFVIFVAGTVLSFTLPPKVDSAARGEGPGAATPGRNGIMRGPHPQSRSSGPGAPTVGPAVTHALAANAGIPLPVRPS